MRVDGENLSAPIERILHPAAIRSTGSRVYAVPDDLVGDAVMAAIVLRDGASLSPGEFTDFLSAQADLSPKAGPRASDRRRSARHRHQQGHQTPPLVRWARIPHGILGNVPPGAAATGGEQDRAAH